MSKRKLAALFVCALSAALVTTAAALQAQQQSLSQKLIRLHVVANSDSDADQALKLQVRDAVLAVTEPRLAASSDPERTICQAIPAIQQAAEATVGDKYSVTVSFGKETFPTRVYESFALPAGVYQSLRVTIGSGEGHNWWCVVFPSICFRATTADLELAAETAGFSDGEVRLITGQSETYELRFKALELLQSLKEKMFAG